VENVVINFEVKGQDQILSYIDLLEKAGLVEKGISEQFRKDTAARKANQEQLQQETQVTINDTQKLATALKELPKVIAGGALDTQIKKLGDGVVKTEKKTISMRLQLRQMKNELNNLDEGSKRFRELSIEAAKLEDKIGDVSQRIRNLASDTAGIDAVISGAQGITGAFAVAEGAAALFGSGQEEIQKTLLKVNAAMAILQGLQQIQAVFLEESAAKSYIAATAQGVYTAVVGTSTGALKAFRIALALTGIGLVVIALGALIANWDKLTGAINDSTTALEANIAAEEQSIAIMKSLGEDSYEVERKLLRDKINLLEAKKAKEAEISEAKTALIVFENEHLIKEFEKERATITKQAEFKEKLEELRDERAKARREKDAAEAKRIADANIAEGKRIFDAEYDVYIRQLQIDYEREQARKQADEDKKKARQEDLANAKLIAKEALDTQLEAIEKEKEARITLQNAIFNATTQTISSLQSINKTYYDWELGELKSQLDAKEISQVQYEAKVREAKRKQANMDKALASFNIGLSTAEAIIKFLANPGGTAGVVLSVAAGVAGAAQLAQVNAKQVPGFKRGSKSTPSGFKWVGEEGPELIHTPGGDTIIPHKKSVEFAHLFMDNKLPTMPAMYVSHKSSQSNELDYKRLGKELASAMGKSPTPLVEVFINSDGSKQIYNTQRYG